MKSAKSPSLAEAKAMQDRLRKQVQVVPLKREPRYIAGVDAAFSDKNVHAAACLYRYPDLILVEKSFAVLMLTFPYVPGFLSFREGPALMLAIKRLKAQPDVVFIDGQGIAHPNRIGIASHIGLLLGIPTIGCAKTRLVGVFRDPEKQKGSWSPLFLEGSVVGAVVRTRDHVKPLFVSAGHLIDLDGSIRLTLACAATYRIPEPLRCADILSRSSASREKNQS